jgi:hypothetical protein
MMAISRRHWFSVADPAPTEHAKQAEEASRSTGLPALQVL